MIEVIVRETTIQRGGRKFIKEESIFSFQEKGWDFLKAVKKIREILSLWTMSLAMAGAKKH